MADLESTLAWLDMSDYYDRFVQAGFDSWLVLCEITEADLEALGVERGHRRKLQREIATSRQSIQNPPTSAFQPIPGPQNAGSRPTSALPGKRSYQHHPKPDSNAPQRPYAAYVLFSNHVREENKALSLPFTEISKMVGDKWQALPPAEKEQWKQLAAAPWEKYKQDLAAYQQTEDYQKYQQYVVDFKAAQSAKQNEAQGWAGPGQEVRGGKLRQQSSGSEVDQSSPASKSPSVPSLQQSTRQNVPITSIEDTENVNFGSKVAISRAKIPASTGSIANARPPRVTQGSAAPNAMGIAQRANLAETPQSNVHTRMASEIKKKAPEVDHAKQTAIQRGLVLPPVLEPPVLERGNTKARAESNSSDTGEDAESTASGIGSMGSTGHVDYSDFKSPTLDMTTPAYVGQSSEVAWMQRLNREFKGDSRMKAPGHESALLPSDATPLSGHPWPADMDPSVVGNQLDPYDLPIKSTADALVKAFFSTVHPAFPILDRLHFLQQYEQTNNSMETNPMENGLFVSVLQMVFAIGAVYAHMTGCDWVGDDRDHLLYFARARVLGSYSGLLSDSVSIGQVQVLGLASVYLMATDQTNRARSALAIAIRFAQGLGMHLKNLTPHMKEAETVHGIYVWAALVSAERALSVMLGRPCMVNEQDCSAPVPLPVNKKDRQSSETTERGTIQNPVPSTSQSASQSSSGLPLTLSAGTIYETKGPSISMSFFYHYLELGKLSQKVAADLYKPYVRQLKWAEIQRKIEEYDNILTQWYRNLPVEFDMRYHTEHPQSEPFRAALVILSHSTRTIINRPALCKNERQFLKQSDESIQTNHNAAQRCIKSARAILQFLPVGSTETSLNRSPIWWTLVHHIKRSATVLLLELAFRAEHMPSEAEEIVADAIKAINWIHSMGAVSMAARRAWSLLKQSLQSAAQRIGASTAGLITTSPRPQGGSSSSGGPYQFSGDTQSFEPGAWLPMTSSSGAADALYDSPFYGDIQMSGMDDFGFMRPSEDHPLFPSASEIQEMAAAAQQSQQEDSEQNIWQPTADRDTYFGFD
ncbi:MAG: hypothetical protein Q9195_009647 [Heterodermia aff. obscurata]